MKNLIIILLLFVAAGAEGQRVSKIFAYSQSFTPGIVPARDINDEKTGKAPGSAIRTEYYIFIVVPGRQKITVQQLRIFGTWYVAKPMESVRPPIYIEQPAHKLLVPATNLRVFQISRSDSLVPSPLQMKYKSKSQLLILYNAGGKQYSVASNFKALEPVHGL
jgi:hypothetical protein